MPVGPVGNVVSASPVNDSKVIDAGNSFQSSQCMRTRNGVLLSAWNPTSRTGNVRLNTTHFRNSSRSPSRNLVCSSKRAADAALFNPAAALARPIVNLHRAREAVLQVVLLHIDLAPIDAGHPA